MEEQMTTIQQTVLVDAKKETDNAMYNIRYQYSEVSGTKTLTAATVSVAEKTTGDAGEGYTSLGDMGYNSGKISMNGFPYSTKTSIYMEEFSTIIEEIKTLLV